MFVYQPVVLKSLTEICAAMGVGPDQIRDWVDAGAPIAVEGAGSRTRYSAELAALQAWRFGRNRTKNGRPDL